MSPKLPGAVYMGLVVIMRWEVCVQVSICLFLADIPFRQAGCSNNS